MPQPTPRITVCSLGGTIAMSSSTGGPVAPALSPADLLKAVPGLDRLPVALNVLDIQKIPGASLTFTDMLTVHHILRDEFADGADGAVVIQGTDTLEETTFLLHLLHDGEQPIVGTGAMRHPGMAGADGPANLLAAIQVAAAPASRGRGCLIVLNDQAHSARHVTKSHTTSTAAFVSPAGAPVAILIEGTPHFTTAAGTRTTFDAPAGRQPTTTVGLITATLGDDGVWIGDYAEHFDAIVIAGFGVGHVPMTWVDVLEKLAASKPVVLASRIPAGPVLTSTYGFTGSESDLHRRGLILSHTLGAYKARLLLWTLLAGGADRAAITTAFERA